ncbi:putative glucose-6-phosphate 1-epimerase [Gracilariopsis chorda]|uniref:glucose-6-phosphate 1-epimerase n=1 Tax=Gracilariopsis chorda TaxID=448386 RepID=A0A2V3J489_9FLOR|nr:putative glucose-6-phosphate 1-epimerase [Gracilariopsis chorda]|eukprot:PXF48190.1 putative glucose-6-phosphate 1-epimerase [Gracilariopsis chorda]
MTANFDEIAKQLQQELKRRAVDPSSPDLPPMPPTDAPPEQQPIEVTHGNNDMPMVIIRHAPSSQEAQVYCYGAAVTSWTTRGEEHFWVSDQNKWQVGGKAIRGGIPICFPQFGPYGDLVQHGFARVSDWRIRSTTVNEDQSVTAVFGLTSESGQEAMAAWPHKFDAEYSVTLSFAGLETRLSVKNTDDKPFSFTCAFHNYFKTSVVEDARVFGFENLKHLNRLDSDKEMAEQEDSGAGVMLTEETDRIYMNAPEELAAFDFATLKVLKIKKTPTLQDATLWNPFGAEGADPGWKNFICIEPACVTKPATLQPGETWVGAQLLGVE